MKNVSIFDLVGQDRPERVAKKKTRKKTKKKGWGTPEERYRRLCLLAQLCRYAYYVKSTSIIPDDVYDKLEHTILAIEKDNRRIICHRYSPTCRLGSDNEDVYPQSVLSLWHFCGDDPRTFKHMQTVIEQAMSVACAAFNVEEI